MTFALALIAGAAIAGDVAPPPRRPTETDVGSHIPVPERARIPENSMSAVERFRVTMAQFARCVVDRRFKVAERLVMEPISAEYDKEVNALATNECLDSGTMRFRSDLMRGPIFVALYRRQYGTRDPGIPAQLDPASVPAGEGYRNAGQRTMFAFADCAVRYDPALARRIVLLPTADSKQDAAISEVAPHLGACLEGGSTIRISKALIEGAFAEVLYREAATQPGANPAETH